MTDQCTSGIIAATSISEHRLLTGDVWDIDMHRLAGSEFASRTRFFSTPHALIYNEVWNRPIRLSGELRPGLIGFGLPGGGEQPYRLWGDDSVGAWKSPWLTSGQEVEMTSTENYQNTILVFSSERFERVAKQVTSGGAEQWNPSSRYLASDPRRAREIRGLVRHLLDYAAGPPIPVGLTTAVAARIEESLICAIVTALRDGTQDKEPRDLEKTPTQRLRLVQTCLDYAADQNFLVSVPELCAAVGRSERTLRYAFQEHLGAPPARYLRLCRFSHCRSALALADPDESTVTEVATHWGFYELGRFAAEFCQLFGMLPSEVLKQSPRLPIEPIFTPELLGDPLTC